MISAISSMGETCSLDVAEKGGQTLKEVSVYLGCSLELVKLIQAFASDRVAKLRPDLGSI